MNKMFLGIDQKPADKVAAMEDSRREITYGELVTCSETMSGYIGDRDLIFCLCRNCLGALEGYLSFVSNRAVPLLLSAKIDETLLKTLIDTYKPKYFWMPEDMTGQFDYERVYADDYGYVLLKTGYPSYELYPDLSLLLTTSGSTGSPKLVRHTYGNLDASARNIATFFGYTPEERAMADLPMQYTMGLSVIHSHLYAGAMVLLTQEPLMSPKFWTYLKEGRATNFTGVPFSYDVFRKLRFTRMDLPDLRTIAEGGGKLTEEVFKELAEYADRTGRRFFATFGQTECTARMAYLPPELALTKTGSIGRAIPEGQLFLLDENGNEIEEMEAEGEMGYRGPNVTMGYAVKAEELALGDEWHGETHTGDLARRDADGCYFIVGRLSRFLKLYGYRISLDRSERMISEEFEIECACSGDDRRMEIYITDASKADQISLFMKKKTKLPEAAFHVNVLDAIPRNDYGKIRYKELKPVQ